MKQWSETDKFKEKFKEIMKDNEVVTGKQAVVRMHKWEGLLNDFLRKNRGLLGLAFHKTLAFLYKRRQARKEPVAQNGHLAKFVKSRTGQPY